MEVQLGTFKRKKDRKFVGRKRMAENVTKQRVLQAGPIGGSTVPDDQPNLAVNLWGNIDSIETPNPFLDMKNAGVNISNE